MSTTATIEATVPWTEFEARVLKKFNMKDPATRYAVKRWRDDVAAARAASGALEVVHAFAAPEVVEAAVAFFRADIAENEAIYRAQVAERARIAALMGVETAMGEHDGYFVDREKGERVAPEQLAVVRFDKTEQLSALRGVVEASVKLAQSNGDGADERPVFPSALGEGIREFADDLGEFIRVNGDEGRNCVLRLCDDRDFAARAAVDENLPKPLRFLAQTVLQTSEKVRLPEQPVGFGFASGR